MANDDVQTNLRIPSGLKEQLQTSAEVAGRSLSAEVAYRVSRGYELESELEKALVDAKVLHQQVGELRDIVYERTAQHKDALVRLATLEAEGRLLRKTRESDIAAATQFLSERVDFLAARAGAAEREAAMLAEQLKVQSAQAEMPPHVRKWLESEAKKGKRSLNAEITIWLELAYGRYAPNRRFSVRDLHDLQRAQRDLSARLMTLRTDRLLLREAAQRHHVSLAVLRGAKNLDHAAIREVEQDSTDAGDLLLTMESQIEQTASMLEEVTRKIETNTPPDGLELEAL